MLLLTSIVLSGKTAVSKTVVLGSSLSAGATCKFNCTVCSVKKVIYCSMYITSRRKRGWLSDRSYSSAILVAIHAAPSRWRGLFNPFKAVQFRQAAFLLALVVDKSWARRLILTTWTLIAETLVRYRLGQENFQSGWTTGWATQLSSILWLGRLIDRAVVVAEQISPCS